MYVKTTTRKTRTGEVRYLQLAHNEWDAAARRSVPKVVYSFGREDQLDTDAIRRLVTALSRLLSPADALAATADGDLAFTESRPYGGAYVLDQLWHRLGIAKILAGLASSGRGRPRDAGAAERVLFGLVANRALAPSSKLAAAEWMSRDVHIDRLGAVTDDACYRAMDWLHAVRGDLERQVFDQVADLLNLEVDLLFFDTTSTYFEVEDADEDAVRDWRGETPRSTDDADPSRTAGFRTHGKSKDSRDDLPQIVIGMAVTRDGIPVRVWCWPGNTSDSALIRQVKTDMRDWVLGRSSGSPTAGSPPPGTGGSCSRAPAGTSSGRSCGPSPRWSRRRCPGRAATSRSPGTCRSRKSACPTPPTGSSSATTPMPPNATPRSAPG